MTDPYPALLSRSSYLRSAAALSGLMAFGLGVNALLNPVLALKAFDITSSTPGERRLLKDFGHVYAIRDLALGAGILAAAYYDERNTLGWMMLAGSGVAVMDGVVSKRWVRGGEWKHWAVAPVGVGLGLVALGLFDRV